MHWCIPPMIAFRQWKDWPEVTASPGEGAAAAMATAATITRRAVRVMAYRNWTDSGTL